MAVWQSSNAFYDHGLNDMETLCALDQTKLLQICAGRFSRKFKKFFQLSLPEFRENAALSMNFVSCKLQIKKPNRFT